ncbi:MAG: hypothetical protein OXE84_10395 [Rhodobacteraceae bacterium]|nr:hypothetical protein [Paracoccaceae bacterium]MCY4196222.1 hypothetical protein [Paracoccaceae bacterium]MCY4326808.1 hypothetical protein [Paracoccaceae bacterium]
MDILRLILFATATILVASHSHAQVELFFDPTNRDGPVVVNAGKAVFEREAGVTTFSESVKVTHSDLVLTCEQAIVKTGTSGDNDIAEIRVDGNVRMTNEGSVATSAWGVYLVPEGRIEMHGGVRIESPSFTLSGPAFFYDLKTGQGILEEGTAADVRIPGG